ncbi:MAG: RNA-binding protein [Ruminococcaceae bacterium]|nr:RNA-binding protein [Oscillospiraceae bacterium]
MQNEEKLLLAKTEDLFRLCQRSAEEKFSDFLDGSQQVMAEEFCRTRADCGSLLWGGYPDAGRRMLGVFPEWQEPEQEVFPIRILKISKSYEKELSHRDFLGTILSLGIDRRKVGDILVGEKDTFVFVSEEVADFIAGQITKIANCGVKIREIAPSELVVPEPKFLEYAGIAASLRLDAVTAAAAGLSRKDALRLIEAEKVSVNHRVMIQGSKTVSEGDLLSIRGVGRIILSKVGEKTRSDRVHLVFKKYI